MTQSPLLSVWLQNVWYNSQYVKEFKKDYWLFKQIPPDKELSQITKKSGY